MIFKQKDVELMVFVINISHILNASNYLQAIEETTTLDEKVQ